MSRAAIYDALLADQRMIDLGIDRDSFLVNYDSEVRPVDRTFIIMGWANDEVGLRGDDIFTRKTKIASFWVHILKEDSTDFGRIDAILNILDDIYLPMIHVDGQDGQTVTCVEFAGRSRDMQDDAYQTICRSTSYRILTRDTATV